jgi:hypothetical protein
MSPWIGWFQPSVGDSGATWWISFTLICLWVVQVQALACRFNLLKRYVDFYFFKTLSFSFVTQFSVTLTNSGFGAKSGVLHTAEHIHMEWSHLKW